MEGEKPELKARLKIIIVDPSPFFRTGIAEYLTQGGYQVTSVSGEMELEQQLGAPPLI